MIICGACGHENESSADFCSSCGAFLEWSGKKVAEPEVEAPPEAVVQTSTPPKGPTTIEAGRTAPAADGPTTPGPSARSTSQGSITGSAARSTPMTSKARIQSPPPGNVSRARIQSPMPAPKPKPAAPASPDPATAEAPAAPAAAAPAAPAPAPAAPAQTEEEAAAAAEGAAKDARMKALVTRPIATTPVRPGAAPPARATSGGQGSGPAMPVRPTGQMGARQPTAQQPGAAKPKVPPKPPKSTKEREFRPGDLYCGNCGEGNEPNRRFCRKCGASLANAPVVATPWYKRLKRKKKVLAAGERAKGKDGQRQAYGMHPGRDKFRRIFKALMIIAVVVLMIALLTPWGGGLRRRLTSAKDSIKAAIIPTYEPIHPTSAQASSALPDHPATLAIDGTSNMAWEPSAPGDGVGQQLVLTFDHQQNIDRIGFLSGVSDKQDEFLAQPRPRQLHLVFSNGTSKDITLKDTPTFQQFSIKAHAVVSVQITVVSVNTSFNGGHTMGIAEVELFRRK